MFFITGHLHTQFEFKMNYIQPTFNNIFYSMKALTNMYYILWLQTLTD